MDITEIRQKIKIEEYEFTFHAIERRIARNISTTEIESALLSGDVIEDYPEFPVVHEYEKLKELLLKYFNN